MKKIIIFILIIVAIIFSGFYYINNQDYTVEDIKSVKILETNEKVTDDEILSGFLPLLLKNNQAYDSTINRKSDFNLIFETTDNLILEVPITFDFDYDTIIYKNEANELHTLTPKDSLFFFKNNLFKTIYKDFEPNFTLMNNAEVLKPYEDTLQIDYRFNTDQSIDYLWTSNNEGVLNIINNPDLFKLETSFETNRLIIYKADEIIHTQEDLTEDLYVPEQDGVYTYSFKSTSDNKIKADIQKTTTYRIEVDRQPVFELSHESLQQGGFLKIHGYYTSIDEVLAIETDLGEDLKFYKSGETIVTYIPISSRVKPGAYDINIKTRDKYDYLYSVDVEDRKFKTQYLYITASTMSSSSNADAYAEYNKYFHPVRKISSDTQYADDEFIMPLKARISTEFGEGRYINDAITSYSHSGLDLAAPKGTPVLAINHGVITLSRHFDLTGNTIIIDHGQGLLSYYLHLDSLNVALDDEVKTGDVIGTVGSTGRSTGPHLHFGTSFYTTYIEPGYLIYGEPITKDNYKKLFE